jgi:hypothetical protein
VVVQIGSKLVYDALDAGLVVHPALVENQIVGQMVQATSRVLSTTPRGRRARAPARTAIRAGARPSAPQRRCRPRRRPPATPSSPARIVSGHHPYLDVGHVRASNTVTVINYPLGRAIKVVVPRKIMSGDPGDRDVYGAQQHTPLLELNI